MEPREGLLVWETGKIGLALDFEKKQTWVVLVLDIHKHPQGLPLLCVSGPFPWGANMFEANREAQKSLDEIKGERKDIGSVTHHYSVEDGRVVHDDGSSTRWKKIPGFVPHPP